METGEKLVLDVKQKSEKDGYVLANRFNLYKINSTFKHSSYKQKWSSTIRRLFVDKNVLLKNIKTDSMSHSGNDQQHAPPPPNSCQDVVENL